MDKNHYKVQLPYRVTDMLKPEMEMALFFNEMVIASTPQCAYFAARKHLEEKHKATYVGSFTNNCAIEKILIEGE